MGGDAPVCPPVHEDGQWPPVGPLAGLLVADFSRVLAGPYCTMTLADLGAAVIKVESPSGDDTRAWAPPMSAEGVATYYLGVNRNKRSVVLDLANPADLSDALELARRADVVVENFRPGGMKKFGLDYESVARVNPGVVYASISGFGSGAGADIPGYDLVVQAMSGLMSLTGDADGSPYRAGVALFDVMSGMNSTIGILAAVRHREHTGEGQHVEVSLMGTALAAMANHATAFAVSGEVATRMGNAHQSVFPYEPLPTADGELVVIAANNSQFQRLCEVLGIGGPEGPSADERFATNALRVAHRDELRPLLVNRLVTRTRQEWFDALLAAGLPCAPINGIDEGMAFAERIGLDPMVHVADDSGSAVSIRSPLGLSATPPDYRRPPPTLGQHSDEVRAWLRAPLDPPTAGATP